MTEKRSDYRKKQSRQKSKQLLRRVKSAFDDEAINQEKVDVNPEFKRDKSERYPLEGNGQEKYYQEPIETNLSSQDKALRLKKRLNRAILIVFVLIILVLLALFHL